MALLAGDESVRWRSTADDLGDKMLLLVGDVFLSAACISYTGAFTGRLFCYVKGSSWSIHVAMK